MIATAEPARFSPTRYAKATADDTEIGIDELTAMLIDADGERVYGAQAIHSWRRNGKAEQGYGPVGMPTPDRFIPRGAGTPIPRWRRGTIVKWLIQTGRMNMITFQPQQPISAGRGGMKAVAAGVRAQAN